MIHWLVQSAEAHPHLAHGIPPTGLLNAAELARFATLKTEKRRRDWLLGRWTAKQLLQQMIWQKTSHLVPLDAFHVENDVDGVPIVNCQLSIVNCQLLGLSISHSNGYAFCAVRQGSGGVGADMERIEPRIESFAADYFTAEELDRLPITDNRLRDTLVTAVWSAKEAVLKALHLGLSVDTQAVSCLIEPVTEPPEAWMPFTIQLDGRRLNHSTPALTGWWRTLDGYVLTLVTRQLTNSRAGQFKT